MTRNALLVTATLVGVLALATLAGCSREKIDWKSAESADTVEAYDHFLERHPDGELSTQARARVAQLNEERDWKRAAAADTADAYRQFLAQHDSGKWAEEARIRVENFSLDGTAAGPAAPSTSPEPAAAGAPAATVAPPHGPREAPSPPTSTQAVSPEKRVAVAAAPVNAVPSQFGIQLGAFHSQEGGPQELEADPGEARFRSARSVCAGGAGEAVSRPALSAASAGGRRDQGESHLRVPHEKIAALRGRPAFGSIETAQIRQPSKPLVQR
ncbi:MAG: hypothetical protein WDO56_16280 [Gammaproteobacteria bacterium]